MLVQVKHNQSLTCIKFGLGPNLLQSSSIVYSHWLGIEFMSHRQPNKVGCIEHMENPKV